MASATPEPANSELRALSLSDLERLDAAYSPIRSFLDWQDFAFRSEDWDQALARLNEQRAHSNPEQFRVAVEIAMRAAAYDSGAIEGLYEADRGFTLSVAFQTIAWQAGMQARGSHVRELFEAQLQGYEMSLDVATSGRLITEVFMRSLHEVVSAPQETVTVLTTQGWQEQALLKGEYKKLPNHVWLSDNAFHTYAPVADVAPEMHRLTEQLGSDEFQRSHPVLQASYVHHALTAIHPFQDGNGRVARALASVYLYRGASIPLVVFKDEQGEYFQSLALADAGDTGIFVDFIQQRAVNTLDVLALQLSSTPEVQLDELRRLLQTRGGLSHTELDALGYALQQSVALQILEQLDSFSPVAGVALRSEVRPAGPIGDVGGFRLLMSGGAQTISVSGQVQPPAEASVVSEIRVLVARDEAARYAFRLTASPSGMTLDVSLRDVHPAESSALKLRVAVWCRAVVNELLVRLRSTAAQSLEGNGC